MLSCALLVAACAFLLGAGSRLATLAGAAGLERVVAAITLAAAAAQLQWLALGLLGLGASEAALFGVAALTWLAARAVLVAPATGAGDRGGGLVARSRAADNGWLWEPRWEWPPPTGSGCCATRASGWMAWSTT